MLKIRSTEVAAKELLPGHLFSTVGPDYWDNIQRNHSIGERVYLRTEEPCPADQEDQRIFRIDIALEETG